MSRFNVARQYKNIPIEKIPVTHRLFMDYLSWFQVAAASRFDSYPTPVILLISFSISGVIFSRMKEVMLYGV